MRKLSCFLLALLMLLSLTGCTPTKTYTSMELTMQVPEDMWEVDQDEDIDQYGFTFAIENEQLFICGLRQDVANIQDGVNMSKMDYAQRIITEYGLAGNVSFGERKSQDYVYLRFSIPLENGVNEYLCGVYKTPYAFWLIQMNGKTEDFDEIKWYEYLDSVTFSH